MRRTLSYVVIVFIICSDGGIPAMGQQLKKKPSVKDSLDGAFDLSDYIIEANGFVPVPILITEPALGNFGGGIVPTARYQGKADILAEGELRWNFIYRWSLMLFGGAGKAFDKWSEFNDAKWVSTIGSGFRYLVARKFQLRMGVDVAKGPDQWAYYIVFGSSWLK